MPTLRRKILRLYRLLWIVYQHFIVIKPAPRYPSLVDWKMNTLKIFLTIFLHSNKIGYIFAPAFEKECLIWWM